MRVSILDTDFEYDLSLKHLTYVSQYPNNTPVPFSKAILLYSIEINNHVYKEVMHFQLYDFKEDWNNKTITEIYLAKKYGIIKFKTNQNLEFSLVIN